MITAGVVFDSWKLETFKRHLDEAGYTYDQEPGWIAGTLVLKVQTESAEHLRPIVEAAHKEAKLKKLR